VSVFDRESGYSSVDKQIGLGGRIYLISSEVSEGSSDATSLFGWGDLSGESSGIIELSRGNS